MTATADARSICRINPMLLPAHSAKASPAPTRASIQATSAIVVSPGLPNGYRLWSAPSTLLDGRSRARRDGGEEEPVSGLRPSRLGIRISVTTTSIGPPSPGVSSACRQPRRCACDVKHPVQSQEVARHRGWACQGYGNAGSTTVTRAESLDSPTIARIVRCRVDRCHDTVDDGGHVDCVADPGHDRAQDGKPIRIRCQGGQRILKPRAVPSRCLVAVKGPSGHPCQLAAGILIVRRAALGDSQIDARISRSSITAPAKLCLISGHGSVVSS